jgi:hypothetical protein
MFVLPLILNLPNNLQINSVPNEKPIKLTLYPSKLCISSSAIIYPAISAIWTASKNGFLSKFRNVLIAVPTIARTGDGIGTKFFNRNEMIF